MSYTSANNKRIAKNTIFLYIRMLLLLIITLYTSRVIVNTLGIEDFGIYNIIGGVIVTFSFVSSALRGATQRFISFELGKSQSSGIQTIFNMSILSHIMILSIFLVLSESVGYWFVTNKLVIPSERIDASRWVFQFSVFTFMASIMQAPYQATIISYEKMSFYAVVSIIDVCLKLAVAFIISISSFDKLIVYSALLFGVSLISLLIPAIYCSRFLNIKIKNFYINLTCLKKIFSYAGWSMLNGCAVILAQQGGNVLLNVFKGVVANGAYGIANQVSSAIYGFVSNFQSAFNPQIVKQFSGKNYNELIVLLNRSSSFSYYLLLIIAVPFMCNSEYVIQLWLGDCPQYATSFCQLLLVYFLLDALQAPLWMLIGATGKMKGYTIWSGILILFNIPVSYFILSLGYSIYWVFIIRVLINLLCCIIRPFYLHHIVTEFSVKEYFKKVVVNALLTTTIVCIYVLIEEYYFGEISPFINVIISIFITGIVIWTFGISKQDKLSIISIIKKMK